MTIGDVFQFLEISATMLWRRWSLRGSPSNHLALFLLHPHLLLQPDEAAKDLRKIAANHHRNKHHLEDQSEIMTR